MFWRTKYKILPIVFQPPKKEIPAKECPICLNNMDISVPLPCGHIFHGDCILDWIDRKRNCPICRLPLEWSIVLKKNN